MTPPADEPPVAPSPEGAAGGSGTPGGVPDADAELVAGRDKPSDRVPLDRERRWFRYHHLFADFLKQRQPSDVSAWHRRASQWFERLYIGTQ